ncbi:MAG TPA: universal stress protein [Ktedonobacterales bacterium]|nr:universal stress protein [Ktedonobacterales bacterium]
MFKALIAVDGSPTSQAALQFARQMLVGKETSVTLLHVIPQHLIYGKGGAAPAEVYDMEKEKPASQALLDDGARSLTEGRVGPHVDTKIMTGDPADVILSIAEDTDVDLIVVGSRGLSATQRFLIGSVSTKVTTHAHCAVLVAHPKLMTAQVNNPAVQTVVAPA